METAICRPKKRLEKITVRPGYQKSKETFENNSRPTKLEFHFSDGSVVETEFGDDYDENAEFTFNFDPILATDCVMVISDVCTGKKYEDCCISEVAFYSQQTDGMMYYERDLIGQENIDAHFSIEAYANNSTFSIYYDAFDDGSNYFGKIITENTALQ